jgi:heme A synthase
MSDTALPRPFVRFAWGVLAYNLLVIGWGAYVRASGSGAGCGDHWPLCNGEIVPRAPALATLIELFHRVTSGLALVLVVASYVWVRRLAAPGAAVRRAAFWSLVFMLIEAAIGAGLVLFEYVAQDQRLARVLWLSAHLANTLILIAWIALTAWFAGGQPAPKLVRGPRLLLVATTLLGLIAIGMTGAIAALGDTLFPAASLAEGMAQDFAPTAHLLLRLRILHPTLAVAVGAACALLAFWSTARALTPTTRALGRAAAALVFVQWAVGTLNLLLLAPIWLQLVHLLMADALWLAFVLLGTAWLAEARAAAPVRVPAPGAVPLSVGR